jgi:hypothetical protein
VTGCARATDLFGCPPRVPSSESRRLVRRIVRLPANPARTRAPRSPPHPTDCPPRVPSSESRRLVRRIVGLRANPARPRAPRSPPHPTDCPPPVPTSESRRLARRIVRLPANPCAPPARRVPLHIPPTARRVFPSPNPADLFGGSFGFLLAPRAPAARALDRCRPEFRLRSFRHH